jgi:sigma-B regulation protein RsbU (phosphoserine phosphatase)
MPRVGGSNPEDPARSSRVRELAIARQIQMSILPQRVDVEGIEISAGMSPAEDIGGDYYDVLPIASGCWIGIGDVAGHGLGAGLIMVMIQSMVLTLVRANADASPRDLVCLLNRLLYENIRGRLNQDDHVTLCLMRYRADGTVVFAGAHEEILVWRTTTGRCERICTSGAWLGAIPDIEKVTDDQAVQLQPGDLMVLYTDGVIESRKETGEQFGLDRLVDIVENHSSEPADAIRLHMMAALDAWTDRHEDDITLIVVRCQGIYWR